MSKLGKICLTGRQNRQTGNQAAVLTQEPKTPAVCQQHARHQPLEQRIRRTIEK